MGDVRSDVESDVLDAPNELEESEEEGGNPEFEEAGSVDDEGNLTSSFSGELEADVEAYGKSSELGRSRVFRRDAA